MTFDKTDKRKSTLILGIGNVLLKDEGVGPCVISRLEKRSLPKDVELLDGGTAGADLLDYMCNREKVIVIDAVDADEPPGTILKLTGDDLLAENCTNVSLHEIGLGQTLQMAATLNSAPQSIVIFAIVPADISCGIGISEQVKKHIPALENLIIKEIKQSII
jgi:hydrogenase maturation protease